MAKTKRILVKSSAGCYRVVCGSGVLAGLAREVSRAGRFSSVHLVSSGKAWAAVGRQVLGGLRGVQGVVLHRFDDSETSKSLRSVERISRSLVRAGADRHSLVVAVGGGVVGDVAGFAASSYLRGVALAQVPTTVVAQTDSAVGGKTGVNLPEGKNLVGAFYPPRFVVADSRTLKTLSAREYRGGLAEIIKYGVIADSKLFRYLEDHLERVLAREPGALAYLIARSVEIKAGVVGKDERESGLREILNFGHTFGHALESATGYRRYRHGEAVAWGMMAAALYGHEVGVTPAADASRIVALVRRLGKLPAWPAAAPARLLRLMASDKKRRGGKLRLVLARRIGQAATYPANEIDKLSLVLRMTPRVAEAGAL
jgi:3-dehydroquinate synthase